MNPFFNNYNTPFESIPFDEIKNSDFKPAILELIQQNNNELQQLIKQHEKPTFHNTVSKLEIIGKKFNRVTSTLFNLHSAETNDEIQKITQEVSPILAQYSNDILFNKSLFERIKVVFENKNSEDLNTEEHRLLEITYNSFVENGALLSEEKQQIKRKLDEELALASLKFGEHVLKETNDYFLHLQDKNKLEGLPELFLNEAEKEAKKRELDGLVFTLQYPSFLPFMKYVKNRELRKELYLANASKAFKSNEYNNSELINKIIQLRKERANLLGFSSHAELVLINRMAKNETIVFSFLNDLLEKSFPFAEKEIQKLQELAVKDGIVNLQAYDHSFYAEKLKELTFDFSEEEVRPYFSLPKCLRACFDLSKKLFGLDFILRTDIQKYNEEVQVFEVLENGNHKALLYTDFFPREGKRAGAWMTSYKGQYQHDGINHRPHISIVCNFTRPYDEVPSLLNFQEVTTLFHEFGHALHGILANTTFESLSGTSVYWDFVELPSQFLENFCYEKEFLNTFAFHHQTNELIPQELVDKIVKSSNFMEAYQTVRQVGLGLLDMNYHTKITDDKKDIEQFENKILESTSLYPKISGTSTSASFSHIFQGGYAAGYYSYKWSEVLDADAFYYFKENGIFNQEVAQKFKILLSKGGTEDPMKLYEDFRGQKPTVDALLKRAGIL